MSRAAKSCGGADIWLSLSTNDDYTTYTQLTRSSKSSIITDPRVIESLNLLQDTQSGSKQDTQSGSNTR